MAADADAFVDLCQRLREMGATEVSSGSFTAKFAPRVDVTPLPKREPRQVEPSRRAEVKAAGVPLEHAPRVEGYLETLDRVVFRG